MRLAAALIISIGILTTAALAARQVTGFVSSRVADQAAKAAASAQMSARGAECMSAVGSQPFCGCLNADLPLEVDFQKYIKITTSTVSPLYLERLTSDDRVVAPRVLSTRDRCVGIFGRRDR